MTALGEREAQALGNFLKQAGVTKVYHSPLERAARTAQIAAAAAGIEAHLRDGLAEWRSDEQAGDIQARVWPLVQACLEESAAGGPLGLVSHGGPIGHLLREFRLQAERLDAHRRQFDHGNPLPPAGAWRVLGQPGQGWELELVFTPQVKTD